MRMCACVRVCVRAQVINTLRPLRPMFAGGCLGVTVVGFTMLPAHAHTTPHARGGGSAVLFMWTVLPAFGAAAYLPSIVLDRPLFIRCVAPAWLRCAAAL